MNAKAGNSPSQPKGSERPAFSSELQYYRLLPSSQSTYGTYESGWDFLIHMWRVNLTPCLLGRRGGILVVEYDVLLRYMLCEWLRMTGHGVTEATTGDEAKTVLSSVAEIDLVVTDMQIPGRRMG